MRTFKQFLAEATINFKTEDSSPAAKQAGREAIAQAAEISGDTMTEMEPYFKKATVGNIQDAYNAFAEAFPSETKAINNLKPDGVGPGEVVLYFIFNNIGIGGKNAPIDIYMDGKEFAEAKKGDRRGATTICNFKITRDSDKAVTTIMKDLEDFNNAYHEITGEDIDGWRGANEISVNVVRALRDIDLKSLAADTKGGSKKAIDLVLKKDGDLLRKGSDEPITNVNKSKTVAPLKSLINGSGAVSVDSKIDTFTKVERRWVDQAFIDYIDGKKFALFDDKLKMRYFGTLTKDMVGLYMTHRNQPWAEVYLEPKSSATEEEVE
jgi:hypothetical protein